MTEDKCHKDHLIKISRSLNKNNRYSDMLPCMIYFFKNLDQHNIALIGSENNFSCDSYNASLSKCNLEQNYINASYIDVSYYFINF